MPRKPTDSASPNNSDSKASCPPVSRFAELLAPARVLCNVEARGQKHAFEILSELLANADHGIGSSVIFDALIQRERLGATGLGQGVALPHGRADELDGTVAAVLKLRESIPYDAPDEQPVRIVFGLLVPRDATDGHLGNLAHVARTLLRPGFLDDILASPSSSALHQLFLDADGDSPAVAAEDES